MVKTGQDLGPVNPEHLVQRPVLDMVQQQTFAGIAHPEFWGIETRELGETDFKDMQLVTPDRLMPSLVGPRATGISTVTYRSEHGQEIHVALTPAEYGLVAKNAKSLGRHAVNRTMASRPRQASFGLDVEAAARSGVHVLEGYADRMERYTTNILEADAKQLESLAEYISNPNLNRLRGDNFRMNIAWLQEHIFGDMFVALRSQRGWTPDQEAQARRAMDTRLFLDRTENRHLANWAETVAFLHEYWEYKVDLFTAKTAEAKNYIQKNG